jgi:hypothetical protein
MGVMIPLHILAGVLVWRQRAWGHVLSTILAFAAFIVFIALSVSLLLLYFLYENGSTMGIAITIGITVITAGVSLVIFRKIQG